MRIISGTHGGRRIRAPKSLPVRPTTDRVKEALFNILDNRYRWDEISVLDLFAGTGNISFEFASRGTAEVISVDQHPGCIKFIRETGSLLNIPLRPVRSEVIPYLEQTSHQFDIIFADPPYGIPFKSLNQLITLVFERGLLNPGGVLILEHDKRVKLNSMPYFQSHRNYGGSVLSFFEQPK